MSWSIVGWIAAALFGALGLVMIGTGVVGLLGGTTPSRIDCDRATGECRASFDRARRTARLTEIVSVEVRTEDRSLGRGARYEKQSCIALKLKDGEQLITQWSADAKTVAGYGESVKQIQAFLAGAEPSLSISLDARQSGLSSQSSVIDGVLVLLLAVVGAFLLRRR